MSRYRLGPSETRGRFDRPADASFALHPDLPAPGAITISEAVEAVFEDWDRQVTEGSVTALAARRLKEQVAKFAKYAGHKGVAEARDVTALHCLRWVGSPLACRTDGGRPVPAALATRHMRRGALRAFFRTMRVLGLHDQDPAADIELPPRSPRFVCALEDAEVEACKVAARYKPDETLLPAYLSVALLGVTTGEMPHLLVSDVHLQDRLLWVHAEGVRSNRARWVALDDYAHQQISRHLRALDAAHPKGIPSDLRLLYKGRADADTANLTATASNAIIRILGRAHLRRPGIRPSSITEYVAVRTYREAGRLEAVAARPGLYSLDATADLLGLEWVSQWLVPGPDGSVPAIEDGRDRTTNSRSR